MRTLKIILVLAACAAVVRPMHAQVRAARPSPAARKSAWRDWRFYVGEGIIATAQILDGVSTCNAFRRGAVETSPFDAGGRSCKTVGAGLGAAFLFDTSLNLMAHHYADGEINSKWNAVEVWAVPAAVSPIHFAAAAHNFRVAEKPSNAAALERIGAKGF